MRRKRRRRSFYARPASLRRSSAVPSGKSTRLAVAILPSKLVARLEKTCIAQAPEAGDGFGAVGRGGWYCVRDEEDFLALLARALWPQHFNLGEAFAKLSRNPSNSPLWKSLATKWPRGLRKRSAVVRASSQSSSRAHLVGKPDADGLGRHIRKHDVKWRRDAGPRSWSCRGRVRAYRQ